MRGRIAAVVFALSLAACGGAESGGDGMQSDQTLEAGHAHALPWTMNAIPEAAAVSGKVEYYGGPVIEKRLQHP